MSRRVIVAARRQTIRVLRQVSLGFTTAQQNFVLAVADERITLYRCIVKGSAIGGADVNKHVWAIHVSPKTTDIPVIAAPVSGVSNLYSDSEDNFKNIGSGAFETGAAGISPLPVNMDTKAMRKMGKGHEVVISTKSSAINAGRLGATITLFFKE